eukprot:8584873-Heterocapsa_arctica.AAC.1
MEEDSPGYGERHFLVPEGLSFLIVAHFGGAQGVPPRGWGCSALGASGGCLLPLGGISLSFSGK